ncbi:MAG: hypothetical protein QOF83_3588 [Solirubrobacteraceae bacterium]|jgi:hypothetical protein|nr:hypothetical protein [Solirubrobacteraceae bacterium]
MRRSLRAAGLTLLVSCALAGPAGLASPALAAYAGTDPSSNHPAGAPPATCDQPTSAACVGAAVYTLDQARASLGQPAYQLPTNFAALSPAQQGFVLANLDRTLYGQPPMTGLTAALNSDAMGGVHADADPQPTAANYLAWTANWAGGFVNMPYAYEAWMYDDGPGSGNLDCTAGNTSGCWGHRHDVLYKFDAASPLAVGVAQGTDPDGVTGFAMLLFEGDDTYHPTYTYTWAQAVAAGAGHAGAGAGAAGTGSSTGAGHGTGTGGTGAVPARLSISVGVRGRQVTIVASVAAGSRLRCALSRRGSHGWARDRYRACAAHVTLSGLRAGRYRLRVRAAGVVVTRYLRVR